jgi:hypothetical protein
MPTRPDLRDIAHNVRDALGDCDRDTLVELLTFVLKEYVVEGPPPMLVHQTETIADLHGLSFAQLVSALQTRLELPELALFAVDGDQVSVRVGGVMHPLASAARGAPAAAELPRPAAGVRVVEATLQQRPAPAPAATPASAPAPAAQAGQAPRPNQGLSVRGQPTGGGAPGPAPSPPAASPAAAPPAPAGEAPGEAGEDSGARFSLLELD